MGDGYYVKAVSLRLRIIKLRLQYNLKNAGILKGQKYGLSKEYFTIYMRQLSDLEEINYCAMMEKYIIYYQGRIVRHNMMTGYL